PTGVGGLYRARGGVRELQPQRARGREIEQVVVTELRPVELLHRGEAHRGRADPTVERGLLVRVLSVAQREGPLGLEPKRGREQLVASARVGLACPYPRQIARDRGVVLGGPAEGLLSQPE